MSVEPPHASDAATAFGPVQQIDAGLLNVGYVDVGPADGPAVLLLHGWPYDIHSYADVAPLLTAAGYRVIVPYLRGYGTTRFLSDETFRNGEQAALAVDAIALHGRARDRPRDRGGLRLGRADGRHRRRALAGTLQRPRLRERLPDRQPGGRQAAVAAGGRAAVVVPVLLRDRARPGRLRQVPARLREADLADRVAEVELRRRHVRPQRGVLRQPRPRRDRRSTTTAGGWAWRRRAGYDELEKRLAEAPSSPCPRSRSRATPTAHRIRTRVPTPRSSRARTRTGRSRAASDTTFPQEAPEAFADAILEVGGGHDVSRLRQPAPRSLPVGGSPARLRRRDRLAQLAAAHAGGPAREGRPRRLLDLHVHQLAAHARLRPRVGRRSTADHGLVVVGVHTPEFPFEHDVDNVRRGREGHAGRLPDRARQRLRDLAARSRNHYWPALYIADAEGRIRHHHFGEGGYDRVRDGHPAPAARGRARRRRRRARLGRARRASRRRPTGRTSIARDLPRLRAGAGASHRPATQRSTSPARTRRRTAELNQWALAGDWTIERRASVLDRAPAGGSRSASTPATSTSSWGRVQRGTAVPFRVLVDGEPPGAAHGLDVDEQGNGTLSPSSGSIS